MKKILSIFCLCLPLFCMAQISLENLVRQYEYDAAGNRVLRKVIDLSLPQFAPPAPSDSMTNDELSMTNDDSLTADRSPQTADYFVERIAQTEIKIYPNPATERITLEIAGWETLQTGVFKLFTLNGQLLQEHPVHAAATEVSLSGLAKGTYILKVHINNQIEDWKIIKN